MEQLGSHFKYFHKILYLRIFRKSIKKKFKFDYILTKITATLHEDLCTLVIISRSVLRRRKISEKICRKIKTRILLSITFPENRVIYEIAWKDTVESDRPQIKIRCGSLPLHAGYIRL